MSLKKYSELTDDEIKKVTLMYSDKDTLAMYLYNFDEHGNYHGRQYVPSTNVTIRGNETFTTVNPVSVKMESIKVVEDKPVKKVSRKPKKK